MSLRYNDGLIPGINLSGMFLYFENISLDDDGDLVLENDSGRMTGFIKKDVDGFEAVVKDLYANGHLELTIMQLHELRMGGAA